MTTHSSRTFGALILSTIALLTGCETVGKMAVTTISPMRWNGHDRIDLPLSLDKAGRPTIPVQIMGQSGFALVDTGSTLASMTPALADSTSAKRGSVKVNGQKRETAEDVPVQIGPATIKLGMSAIGVGDNATNAQLTLGMELFLQAVVEMDFAAGRLTLIRRDTFSPPVEDAVSVTPLRVVPTVQLSVNGNKRQICAILDTGFNAGLVLTTKEVNELALRRVSGSTRIGEGFAGVRTQATELPPLEEVRIGKQAFHGVPAHEVPAGLGDERCPHLFGMAALSRYRLIFDLKAHRVWFLPRVAT